MSLGIHSEVDEQRSGEIFSSSGILQIPSWMGFSNGNTWRFCKLAPNGKVYQTVDYSTAMMEMLLGQLRYVFMQCNQIMIDRETLSSGGT
jgi:hypothetical protein